MLVGLVLGYVYASSSDPAAAVPALEADLGTATVQALKGARIDTTLLKDDTFTSLRVFGSLPVKAEAGGKNNPFQ
jgi:hypothetical protein